MHVFRQGLHVCARLSAMLLRAAADAVHSARLPQVGFDEGSWHEYYRDIIDTLSQNDDPKVQMCITSSLWVDGTVKTEFKRVCQRVFSTEVQAMPSTGRAALINGWVSRATSGKIASILSHEVRIGVWVCVSGSVSGSCVSGVGCLCVCVLTRCKSAQPQGTLVIANVVYMKGMW